MSDEASEGLKGGGSSSVLLLNGVDGPGSSQLGAGGCPEAMLHTAPL